MNALNEQLQDTYMPVSALVLYKSNLNRRPEYYIESFDFDVEGRPVNAHPLTLNESASLLKALSCGKDKERKYLSQSSLLSTKVLYVAAQHREMVIWFTPAQARPLYFVDRLGLENGTANVPAMLWMVKGKKLSVFALKSNRRPKEETRLYRAPFFNIYSDHTVCLGNVDRMIHESASLEAFMIAWERFFFHSYFSHLLNGQSPVKGNCVNLWRRLVNSDSPFPKEELKDSGLTLKKLLP